MTSSIVSSFTKKTYGEVRTPKELVQKILDLFPIGVYSNPNHSWLDVGACTGQFSIELFKRLDKGLAGLIPEKSKRARHIVTKMIYMVEIQPQHVKELRKIFGEEANIHEGDFLKDSLQKTSYNYIIGNPPFNSGGLKKVPTNTISLKHHDGKTIWPEFVRKSMSYLIDSGYLAMITPSLWMHKDKAKINDLFTANKICYIRCYTNTETNQIFKGEAQTPTCYFLVKKTNPDGSAYIYDTNQAEYIRIPVRPDFPLPVFGVSVISKLIPFVTAFGYLKVTTSKSPPKEATFSFQKNKTHIYPVVKTCILDKLQPKMKIVYSNQGMPFMKQPKIILAHKMYGFPYIDINGTYGVSFRDNFIITIPGKTKSEIKNKMAKIADFLSTKLALYIFEAARYRMKYLDKYAFQFIPDITKLPNFPTIINNKTMCHYFGLDPIDINAIETLHKRSYKTF